MRTVYCVIVTYNGMQWINRCLSSLEASVYPVKIIVFDNGSKDDTCAFIERNYQRVRLIRSAVNLGFGQANNAGMKIALQEGTDAIFLLNQDAAVRHDTLSMLMKAMELYPDYGILSPVHLNGTGKGVDVNFLQYFRNSALNGWVASKLLHDSDSAAIINTEFVNAAAWLVPSECIRKTGGFDPFFFHYGEDINYCQRVIYHQYAIGICLDAIIYHDRENRLSVATPSSGNFKKEWINMANYFCDIRRKCFTLLYFKRLLRYILSLFTAIIAFRPDQVRFYARMVFKMANSFLSILKSRKFSRNSLLL